MTALVLCALLMIAVAVGVRPIGRALQRRWPGPAEPVEMTATEVDRLQTIADVPLVDIIEAAERRATHPDEPLPKILADLDPETRVHDTAPATPAVDIRPSLGGFLNEFGKPRPSNGLLVLPPGMDCKVVVPIPPKREPDTDNSAEQGEQADVRSAAFEKVFHSDAVEERLAELGLRLTALGAIVDADSQAAYDEIDDFDELTPSEHFEQWMDACAARADEVKALADKWSECRVDNAAQTEPWPGQWRTQFHA